MHTGEYRKRANQAKRIAKDRIERLFERAQEIGGKDIPLANRYVTQARNMSMRFNVPIQSELRKRFCKHCYTYLVPGLNCRVRTQKEKVVYTCSHCHKFMRFPYLREKRK
jgi:ribonuclease P protein subunit RPR2